MTPILTFSGIAYSQSRPHGSIPEAISACRVGTPTLNITSSSAIPANNHLTPGTHYTVSVFIDDNPDTATNSPTSLSFCSSPIPIPTFRDLFSTETIAHATSLATLELGLEIIDTSGHLSQLPLHTTCRVEITADSLGPSPSLAGVPAGNVTSQPHATRSVAPKRILVADDSISRTLISALHVVAFSQVVHAPPDDIHLHYQQRDKKRRQPLPKPPKKLWK